jgi:Dolichyl-phosphate-mannose-protein mannosyltransferase
MRARRWLRPAARDLLVVLAAGWLVRAAVIATWPASAHSDDLDSWIAVARALRQGANPYVATDIVKWPPFAIVLVWLIDHVARAIGVSFFLVMRVTLIAAESAVVVVLYLLLARFAPARAVRRILLVGISLNPIAILFVCQHENIDVFVGLFVVLALWALVTYERTGEAAAWLAACLALGLGAFTKTTPIILAPLLVSGFRAASKLGRTLGVALFLGPIGLGLSVVFVLAPHAVARNVLHYRSISGYFGVTGLLGIAGRSDLTHAYGTLFLVALVAVLVLLTRAAWTHGLSARRAVLLAGLLLAAVPVLGPGYAPQYAYWYLPALIASYPLFDNRWRTIVLGCYAVAAVDYLVEYALLRPFGRFLVAFFDGSGQLRRLSDRLSTAHAQTELRLPLFLAFLVLLAEGARRLGRRPIGTSAAVDGDLG